MTPFVLAKYFYLEMLMEVYNLISLRGNDEMGLQMDFGPIVHTSWAGN